MSEEKSAKTERAFISRSPEAAGDEAPRRWREDLTRFFDENERGRGMSSGVERIPMILTIVTL